MKDTFALDSVVRDVFDRIAVMSPDVAGVSRPAFSDRETEVLDHLRVWAEGQGLHVEEDAGRNLFFSLPQDAGAKRFVLIGSHVDTVPQGGNFDGLAGVIAGLVCLMRARDEGPLPRAMKAIAMRGEESAWFGPCYIASKALTGTLAAAELDATHKGDGRSLEDHMADVGIDTGPLRAKAPLMDLSQILEYIELHIEQGPLLVEKKVPAAVVSGIRGNIRHRAIRCIGEAGHSGAVPRAYRRDPVLAMADLLVRLDESWLTILQKGDDMVLTCGMLGTDPAHHALSRIADEVTFSLDIRSQSADVLDQMRNLTDQEMRQVARERKVRFDAGEEMSVAPALMDPGVVASLSEAMRRTGLDPFVMPSGGGHDAAVFANAGVPTGMVFVRNENGSHNPDEAMTIDDFLVACDIMFSHLQNASG